MSNSPKQFVVRFPDGIRERLQVRASANGRSMNAEIVAILTAALDTPDDKAMMNLINELRRLDKQRGLLEVSLDDIDERVGAVAGELRAIAQPDADLSDDDGLRWAAKQLLKKVEHIEKRARKK